MKNFFKKIFGKKYPDRNNDPSVRTGRVYAGPDDRRFRNRAEGVYAGPPSDDRDTAHMKLVYAGPRTELDPPVEDVEIEEVYNGPGMMDEIGFDPVEEEPAEEPEEEANEPAEESDSDDTAETESVKDADSDDTAATEQAQGSDGDTDPEEPRVTPPMGFVYAGPANLYYPTAMAVYAGPQQMSSSDRPTGFMLNGQLLTEGMMQADPTMPSAMMAYFGPGGPNGLMIQGQLVNGTTEQNDSATGGSEAAGECKVCPNCGGVNAANSKFCRECGSNLSNVSARGEMNC